MNDHALTSATPDTPVTPTVAPWWRDAVIYQVYIRSFADGNGDGLGDVAGIRSRLPYLRDLGVDAIWVNPWYTSPMADAGYDVADFREIDPRFGTVTEVEALVSDAHELGLRVIPDIVPNHTSDQHQWFQEALASTPGSPQRQRYVFRPGRGAYGDEAPNNWRSRFGGPAWTRIVEPDGTPGEWYLHLFAPEQPDLNWENPEVAAEFESILRFWFDRGIDGFRIDVAHGLIKDPNLPDIDESNVDASTGSHPHWDRDVVHEIYQQWRRVADSYPGDRTFVAEAWTDNPERLARYVRSDGLHTAFNFDFLISSWESGKLREVIDMTLRNLGAVGAPATWVLSNHDVVRHPSRFGRPAQRWVAGEDYPMQGRPDRELGLRRARAAGLLTLALPGGVYIYQGEELGLDEVEDLPEGVLQDPMWERSGHTTRGRDGCRVPLPWSGETAPYGFSASGVATWLPQPEHWKDCTVETQDGDESSMLELYRTALRIRREHPALGEGSLDWLDTPEGVLGFSRAPGFACVVNLGEQTCALPAHSEVLLASGPLDQDGLPADTAAWLAL